jgi:hypothetical protein
MPRTFDVIVSRKVTESCTMLIEAENRAAAIMIAQERSYNDPDLVWEQADEGREHTVASCEAMEDLGPGG